MLLTVDFDKDFIDVEGIAIATMLLLQSPGVNSTELDTPESNRFAADRDASFCQQILNISVTQVEAIVQPDSVGNDFGRESVALICIHLPSLTIPASLFGNTLRTEH